MFDSTPVEEEEEAPWREMYIHTSREDKRKESKKTYTPISVKEHEIDFEV